MNRTDVNKVEVNRVRVNMCTVNSFAARKAKGGTAMPVPIASYRAYDKANDDEDRAVLKDLTGNGHDIQLYNFAFDNGSGYGKYPISMSTILYDKLSYDKFHVTQDSTYFTLGLRPIIGKITVKFTISNYVGDNMNGFTIRVLDFANEDETLSSNTYSSNGEYTFNFDASEYTDAGLVFYSRTPGYFSDLSYDIEFIPEHKGALVSDGVDDYGLCENFPILTKEKGYTVCAIREIISDKGCFLSNRKKAYSGAFSIELYLNGKYYTTSFSGDVTQVITMNSSNLFIHQNSNYYNNQKINAGPISEGVPVLCLFNLTDSNTTYTSSLALYALEIYDRDLTDEEIATVKARMIAEYEEKTGNKYEEETV
ncbi:hypothetical protein QUW56_02815 [Phocaeicola barnesiae]|uniref:hypothetical protein n=1 Tax=Phocaeicola barnesiae TaxID=376804 RepID=UPI0025A3A577|nr:hypothetical protein [Phocaeicola barnesiae]MDM8232331.1 hypothetical protein [Phocaeicola barnesiae]